MLNTSKHTTLLQAIAIAATLACTSAGAATYGGYATIGKLRFEVTDLTPDVGLVAGYTFNTTDSSTMIGSMGFAELEAIFPATANLRTDAFKAKSNPLTIGETGSPFDTASHQAHIQGDHGAYAHASVEGNYIAAYVQPGADHSAKAYAEGVLMATSFESNAALLPNLSANTILLSAHSRVTIRASASVFTIITDATACPGCEAQFTGYGSLVASSQFNDYQAAIASDNQIDALRSAGISFTGLAHQRITESNPNAVVGDFLELTLLNDSDSQKGFGFFADAWIQGQSFAGNPAAVPEPETWGLALAGLLVSGIALRRRG